MMKKLLLGLIFTLTTCIGTAQIVCDVGITDWNCSDSTTLVVVDGENITAKLKTALDNYCQVRIPNLGTLGTKFLVDPMTFSGDANTPNTALQNKKIILDEGVILETTQGGTSYCSQSMFTFDGEANRNIGIFGDYTDCDFRPVIRMPEVQYFQDSISGYLVASDDVDEPYLNDNGLPNFVFSDFDTDPYFDDMGNPNLINAANPFPMVPADCDYNYNLCNRDIIVWCPMNWEGRHLIAIHGAQKITVQGIGVENASGGDGIILAAAENGAPSKNILIRDVHYIQNGRTGLNVKSALCMLADENYVERTGDQIGIDSFVNINGAVAFEPLLDTTDNEYYMKEVRFRKSTLADNDSFGIRLNFPSLLNTTYQLETDIELDSICIAHSETGIEMDTSQFDLEGRIEISNVQIFEVDTAFRVTEYWKADDLEIDITNLDMSQDIHVYDAIINPMSSFCQNLDFTDVCLAYSPYFCNQNSGCDFSNNNTCTGNDNYSCVPGFDPDCPVECVTEKDVYACYNQPLTLEAKIDIATIVAERPLPLNGWRNEIGTDHCGLNGDVELCFDFADEENRTLQVLGLNADPTTNAHYNTIDYGIYLLKFANGTHRIRVYENGALKYSINTGVNLVGTNFCIKRVNGEVAYYRDGVLFYTSDTPSDDLLYFDNSFYSHISNVWSTGTSVFANITYSILGNSSLVWSPGGATTPSITVSVTENTVYRARFLNGTAEGCKNEFRFNLMVVDTPALTPIIVDPNLAPLVYGTDITICDGEQVILSFEEHLSGNTSYTYDWTTPANSGQTLPIGTAGQYFVTITDTIGCTQIVEFNVNVDPLPDVTLTGGHLTCVVTSVDITGPSGYLYTPALPFTVTDPDLYCFIVTDPLTGCSIQECVEVTQDIEYPAFDCQISYTDVNGNTSVLDQCDISICPDECVVLSAEGNNPSAYNYQWSSNTSAGTNPWQTVDICNTTDDYSVTITDPDNGCTQVLDFSLSVDPAPDVTLTGGHLTCDVMSVDITGPTTGYTYDPPLPFTVINPGNYCFEVTDANTGCVAEACVAVTQDIENPDLDCQISYTDVNGNTSVLDQCDISICPDECVVLSAEGNNPTAYNYQWSSNTSAGTNPWQTVDICNTSDDYSVTITDPVNGCTQVLDFSLSVDPAPDVTLVGGELTCDVTSINITGPSGFIYDPALPFTATAPGSYCFEVKDPVTGCVAQECATVTQDITPPDLQCEIQYTDANGIPIQLFDCELQICPGDCVVLVAHGNNPGAYDYAWSSNVIVGSDPWLTDDVCGEGTYSVTITDPSNGCTQELVFEISADPNCMTVCNAPPLQADGGNTIECFDFPGLPAGQNICWEFFTGSLPDQLTVTIGGVVVLNTGLISTDSGNCGDTPGAGVTTLNPFGLGNCVVFAPPLVGSGVTAPGPPTGTGFDLHGTIPITAALANQPIEFCVDGTQCSVNTGWFLDIFCCDTPGPCVDDPADNPITTSCQSTPNGTGINWTAVPGAVEYEVILDQTLGTCCPGAPSDPPIIVTTTGTNFTVPPNAPTCFTWLVIAYAANGDVIATSTLECMDANAPCVPINPDPCPNITPPSDVGCESVNGVTTISWSPVPASTGNYTVSIQLGGACCPGDVPTDVPTWYIYQVSGENFDIPPSLNGQCFTFTISALCADFSSSDPSHPICYNLQDGCTPDPIPSGCETSENGTNIVWGYIAGAVRYEVIMNPSQGACCPDAPGQVPPIVGSTNGTSMMVTPDVPECFTYQVVAYNANGGIIATSDESCLNDAVDCVPVVPPPCEVLTAPSDIGCILIDGSAIVYWTAKTPGVKTYAVSVTTGGPCCSEGQNEGSKQYIYQVIGEKLTLPTDMAQQCFTLDIRALCPDFASSGASETVCYNPETGCMKVEQKKERSVAAVPSLQEAFTVYPNPAKEQVNISFANFVTQETAITIDIINSQSQVVRSINTSIESSADVISIATEEMPAGLYFIQLKKDKVNEVFIQKVVLIK